MAAREKGGIDVLKAVHSEVEVRFVGGGLQVTREEVRRRVEEEEEEELST